MADDLVRKLLIRPGDRVLVLDPPEGFLARLRPLPDGASLAPEPRGRFDVVHLFVRDVAAVERRGPEAIEATAEGGRLWLSYPKRSSGHPTDLTRDRGWEVLRERGWRAVTQVSVDETWSALRFRPVAEIGS